LSYRDGIPFIARRPQKLKPRPRATGTPV